MKRCPCCGFVEPKVVRCRAIVTMHYGKHIGRQMCLRPAKYTVDGVPLCGHHSKSFPNRIALAAPLALLLLLPVLSVAATWTAPLPTTGAPCVEWRWRAYDPSGFVFHDALTDSNWATIPEPDVPQKVECQCFDAIGRASPWSPASEPYFPPRLLAQYWRAGLTLGFAPLSMNVALIRGVEWIDPNEGE